MKIYIRSDSDNITEQQREDLREAQYREYEERQSRKKTDSDYKAESKDMWNRIDFVMLDVDATEIESDPHEFALHVEQELFEKFNPLYNDTWYAVMLGDPRAKMLVMTNKSHTISLINFKGTVIDITRRSVKTGRVFLTEFDRWKFLKLFLDEDLDTYK